MEEEFGAKRKEILKNRLYGLLCEREKDGSWEEFLDNILMDFIDIENKKNENLKYNVLVSKLALCKYLSYKYYRKTIFECMNLIDRMDVHELF